MKSATISQSVVYTDIDQKNAELKGQDRATL